MTTQQQGHGHKFVNLETLFVNVNLPSRMARDEETMPYTDLRAQLIGTLVRWLWTNGLGQQRMVLEGHSRLYNMAVLVSELSDNVGD